MSGFFLLQTLGKLFEKLLDAKYSSLDWFILLFHSTEIDACKIGARALRLCALIERSGNFHAIGKRNYFPTYAHSLKVS